MQLRVPEKLAMTLCLLVTSLTAPPHLSLALVTLMLIARRAIPGLRPMDNPTARRFRTVLGFLLGGAIIMTFLNGVLIREGPILFQWAGISLYDGGIEFGVRTGSRLLLMTSALLILFGSTPLSGITTFLHQIGVPIQIVMTIHLTVHFVASMPSRIERIYSAQEARGAPLRAHSLSRMFSLMSILSPLILSSIVESIERGKALELRGYSSAPRRADDTVPFSSPYSILTICFLLLSIAALLLPWLLG